MKTTTIFATLLLAVNTSSLAQSNSKPLPKDFPKECVRFCEGIDRAWREVQNSPVTPHGCAEYTDRWGFGSDDGTIAGSVRNLFKAGGTKQQIVDDLKGAERYPEQIRGDKNNSESLKVALLKGNEMDMCVLRTLVK